MYTKERIDWWIGRSRSPEYQVAYRNIASHLKGQNTEVIIEMGCGPGEMLAVLHEKTPYRLMIGTDTSDFMLQVAEERLEKYGIKPRIERDASKICLGETGVVLLLDDMIDTKIPAEIADSTLLVFPDVYGDIRRLSEEDRDILRRCDQEFSCFSKRKPNPLTVKIQRRLSNTVKKGGISLMSRYETSSGITSSYDVGFALYLSNYAKLFGMKLEKNSFYESPDVYDDTHEYRNTSCKRGYIATRMRKL